VHELSLCQAIVDTVERHRAGRQVRQVNVRIGYLRQVVPDSLLFSWTVMTDGTDLADSELLIEHVAAVVACRSCGARTELDRPLLVCRGCESGDVELLSGEEFQLVSIDVAEQVR